jgi:hypothetical protein
MTARPVPRRHWRSYGDDTLPTGAEALDEPFAAFPSWFMGITSDRRGQEMVYRGGCVAELGAQPFHL